MWKKRLCLILILSINILSSSVVFANTTDNENINVYEIVQTCSQDVESEIEIESRIAVVYDRNSGKVLWGKDENKRSAMASTTKIMTAIVTLENGNLDDIVKISSKAAWTGGSSLNLKTGDEVKLEDLLYGLMLKSGNDAAVAIAEHIGGSVEGFSQMMNKKANELGLKDTHFVTPHGLDDPEHYTTAKELAIISDYAMKNNKFEQIVSTKNYSIFINGKIRRIENTNELLGVLNGVKGIKTGFTSNAGRCLVTCVNRDGWEIIVVVLKADTKKMRTADSVKLIEYIYKNYSLVDVQKIVEEKFLDWRKIQDKMIAINKCKNNSKMNLQISKLDISTIPVKNSKIDKIEIDINSIYYFNAPVEKNTTVGKAKVLIDNEVIDVLKIYNLNKIEQKNIANYFRDFINVFN